MGVFMKSLFKKNVIAFALIFMLPFSVSASRGFEAYSDEKFQNYQKQNKSIVLHVHADWCGLCRKQKAVIDTLRSEGKFDDVVFLEINYDKDKDALQKFGVFKQSVIIAFKGNKETDRLLGTPRSSAIEKTISSSL